MGAPVWEGKLDIVNDLNKEVTTSFPIDEALPDRKPGVYVLTAQPENDKSDDWQSRATQWFVVSDIGLTTYTGEDGLNVFARSLATAKPLVGVDLTLLARNNEVLGTAKTDETGRATFTPGLTRGEGGMVPAVLMASEAQSDFVFLDMSRAGFDLSDRGVAGRPAPGALDLYAWTERGIYRVGEHVHVGALARDAAAKAVENLPLTFIFTRPDGVEDRRIVSDGKSAGGHAVDLDLAENAMRGTWSVGIYTDPKKEPVTTQMFLVEDFVPDRIEFDLTADKKEIGPGELANVTVDGRFLYGAPAAGLAIEGEVNLSTDPRMGALQRLLFRPGRRAGRRCDPHPADRPAAGRRGRQGDLPGRGRHASVDDAAADGRRHGAHARERRPRRRALARPRRALARRRARHQAGILRRRGAGRRHRQLQGDPRRSDRRQEGPGRPAMVAGPPRPLLPVVPQQQLLELRADHLDGGDRQRQDRRRATTAKARSPCRSTGAATGSKSRPTIRPVR